MGVSTTVDRFAMRTRPEGAPMMEQTWENLLFLHWAVDASQLRTVIPAGLELDTFDGKAWVGITPFTLTNLRLLSLPPIPGFSSFHELNLRTYVLRDGKPGIWFFSLDASRVVPALAARLFFQLRYFSAEITFNHLQGEFRFAMQRTLDPEVRFEAKWQTGQRLRAPDAESLAFFLVERYALFAQAAEQQFSMTRIYHHPWILDEAIVLGCESTLFSSIGLPEPTGAPLAHFSNALRVEVWPPVPA